MAKCPYFNLYHVDIASLPSTSLPHVDAFQTGYINQSEMDALYPINPVTGMRDDVLSQIVDPGTGELKKSQLLSTIQKIPSPQHRSVDDDTLLSMLQSRFTQSRVECDDFAKYVEKIVNDGIKSADPEPTPEPTPQPEPSPEPQTK